MESFKQEHEPMEAGHIMRSSTTSADNCTNGRARRHTTASISHTRLAPSSQYGREAIRTTARILANSLWSGPNPHARNFGRFFVAKV